LDGVVEYGWENVKKFYVAVVKILENKKMVKNAGKKKVYHKQFMIISFTNRSIEVQIILTTSNKWINSTYKIYFLGINAFTAMPSKKMHKPDYHCTIVHFVHFKFKSIFKSYNNRTIFIS
jgi:hypothetical protein